MKNGELKVDKQIKAIIKNRYIYLILIPGMAYLFIFSFIPMYGIQIAFKNFMIDKGFWGSPWIGFLNFKYMFIDQQFWVAFTNTIVISVSRIAFTFFVPVILAIIINELSDGKYRRVLQTALTFPHFLSWVIISGILFNILNSDGLVNHMISQLGLKPISFLGTPALFRPLLYLAEVFKESGWGSIIYLASIAAINPEIYEAAIVDGANTIQRIWHVTLPGIKPTMVLLLVLGVGNVMNAGFDQIFNLYNPVVYPVADIIDTYIYRITFQSATDFGFSTAVGLFKSVLNFIFIISANKLAKLVGENGLF